MLPEAARKMVKEEGFDLGVCEVRKWYISSMCTAC